MTTFRPEEQVEDPDGNGSDACAGSALWPGTTCAGGWIRDWLTECDWPVDVDWPDNRLWEHCTWFGDAYDLVEDLVGERAS